MPNVRTELEPIAWLKSVGTQEEPLRADWRVADSQLLNTVWFSKHPRSIRAGDLLVYYATRHGSLVAIAEVASDDVHEEEAAKRFRFSMSVRPIVTVGLREAPRLTETPISPSSLRRQSHIRLEPGSFEIARSLLLAAAERSIAIVKA